MLRGGRRPAKAGVGRGAETLVLSSFYTQKKRWGTSFSKAFARASYSEAASAFQPWMVALFLAFSLLLSAVLGVPYLYPVLRGDLCLYSFMLMITVMMYA